MKKPKITEGEWEQQKYQTSNHVDIVSMPKNEIICELQYFGADKEELTANAKAIAQVPNMIDALIDLVSLHDEINNGVKEDSERSDQIEFDFSEALMKAKKVLTDAGCKP